jgi:hypothetical protein
VSPSTAILGVLLLFWIVGTLYGLAHCGTVNRNPIASKLPFEHLLKPPVAYARANFTRNTFTVLVFLLGPASFSLGLMKLQSLTVAGTDKVAFFNAENFSTFLLPSFPLVLSLYGVLYRAVLRRFPDHELYQIFSSKNGMSFKWDIDHVRQVVRKDRCNAAKVFVWSWFLTGPLLLLGFDTYVRINTNGMTVNPYWGVGEKQYNWSQLKGAHLCGGITRSRYGPYFSPHFVVRTDDGQIIDLLNAGGAAEFRPLTQALSAAHILSENGVPLVAHDLNPRESEMFSHLSYPRQVSFNKFWQDIRDIRGTSRLPASSKPCECD